MSLTRNNEGKKAKLSNPLAVSRLLTFQHVKSLTTFRNGFSLLKNTALVLNNLRCLLVSGVRSYIVPKTEESGDHLGSQAAAI